jgi:peptidoglycan/LPS O-acetylase OafA/YrhL
MVLGALPLVAVVLLANFWVRAPAVGPDHAASPFQPLMAAWSTVVFGALYLAADRLSRARSALAVRVVDQVARLSFGIFLAHPLVLDLVLSSSRSAGVFSRSPGMVAVAFVITFGGAVALCALLARTPLSLALIGRRRERHPAAPASPAAAAD